MRHNSFTDLHTLHIQLVGIANNFASANCHTVEESYIAVHVDFRNSKAVVLCQSGFFTQAVAYTKGLYLANDSARCCFGLYLYASHRWLLGRENYVIQIEITARSSQVLHLEALYMDTLHQLLTVGIECIQRIDGIVLGLVCR